MTDHGPSIIDRYVYSVARLLPRAQRNDIGAELLAILQSQVDEEEAALGRRLSDDEVRAILQNYGHPRDVAANYGSQQYLIGPDVFPSYVATVRTVLYVLAPITVFMVLMTVLLAEDRLAEPVAETLWTAVTIGLVNLAIVTLVFVFAGRGRPARVSRNWDPNDLPELHASKPLSRYEVLGSLSALLLMLCWWLGVNSMLRQWFGWDPLPFEWSAVWTDVHYAAIAVILANIGRELVALFRPDWTKVYAGTGALLDVLAFLVLGRLVSARTFIAVSDSAAASGSAGMLVVILDKLIFAGLILGAACAAANVIIHTLRFVRLSRFALGPQH